MSDHNYAGFWIRFLAAFIDSILVMLLFGILFTLTPGMDGADGDFTSMGMSSLLIQYVLPAAATIWFWLKFLGTPGKMLLNLQVVDADTRQPLTTPQAIGRYLGYYISMIPLMLGFIWVAFDPKKQGFHDKLAGTVVIRGGKRH